jgi:hypothetical protein
VNGTPSVSNPSFDPVSGHIQFCDSSSLDQLQWPGSGKPHQEFLETLLRTPSQSLIHNVRTGCELVRVGSEILPVTVNETDYENSWVCSPFNAAITYPLDELREIQSQSLRWLLAGLIRSMSPLLKAASINRVVTVNNWLLSTNLYPNWDGSDVETLTKALTTRWPQHAILFRSLNAVSNGGLMQRLLAAGYLMAPSRQIYLCHDLANAAKKQNSEIDHHLLTRRTKYRIVRHAEFTEADVPRIRDLYNQLYLDKYSVHNPQFSNELIHLWRRTGLLSLIGLRSPAGSLDGVVGCFALNGVVTTPLIGYDLSLPQSLGLYRMLTSLVFQEARETGSLLNLSAGAAKFKRHRGGEPVLEYSAIYIRHLPMFRRAVWRSLASLLRSVGARVLQHYEL